jgi:hypothetical protein
MHQRFLILVLLGALFLTGCTAGGALYSIFGARDSNQADLNRINSKNQAAAMAANY